MGKRKINNSNSKKKGTLCTCGSLNFDVISVAEDKYSEEWKCQECGNLFDITWKNDNNDTNEEK